MKITTQVEITDDMFKDLLCTAFEGGSNYWIESVTCPDKDKRNPKAEYWHECPVYGDVLEVHTQEDAPDDKRHVTLDRAAIEKGMTIFAEKYPKCFQDLLNENADAGTADTFLQCCIFGEAIYG